MNFSQIYSFRCLKTAGNADEQPELSRTVYCNEPDLQNFPTNYVSTTRYNLVTFVPKCLFEQFRRAANLHFLLLAALSVTNFSPFQPASQISPLAFVLFVSMVKEALEDWGRFKQDRSVNSRTVLVHSGGGVFQEKPWRDARVGEVVRVGKDQYFPSDVLLLGSSSAGACYVDTMNLDGETSLKFKMCLDETAYLDDDAKFTDFLARIDCEAPNPDLYRFVGNFQFQAGDKIPLSPAQILLRDSKLRNTEFVYGAVVFTGPDAKAVRNSTESPSKRSRMEKRLDMVVYLLFGILVAISFVNAIGAAVATKHQPGSFWYLQLLGKDRDAAFDPDKLKLPGTIFRQLVRALILYGYLIPISLYISMEAVKVLQALIINRDESLYDESTGKRVEARTSNLNEEVGQVEIILSDKTGTLTCNRMEFRRCSIGGRSYDNAITSFKEQVESGGSISYSGQGASTSYGEITEEVDGASTSYGEITEEADGGFRGESSQSIELREMPPARTILSERWRWDETVLFFRVLALCHTGLRVEDGTFEAESPEEVAFLVAAEEFGFKFVGRSQSRMSVDEFNPASGATVKREFELLNLLEFTSARKRMSVIVRDDHDDIFLFCKGADDVIFKRLGDGGRTYQSATIAHLSAYSEDGLRTLVLAFKRIGPSEYSEWNQAFANAKATIGEERDDLLEAASQMIEKDLVLLGAVAVEDRLQLGVPECIDKLAQAGIKIWLLTGDKRETAINIGSSCSLLRQDMKQFHLSLSGEAERAMEEELLSMIRSSYEEIADCNRQATPSALIVDGTVLELALTREISNHFFQLAVKCDSVICCRVSPKQKALVTRLVKEFTGKVILAIGDGANDVGMIQEANIGVGISGAEGMQAVMASDFSLPEFRFLERLLLVHGHWCYKRIAKLILYFMYKNVAFGLTVFYHQLNTRFSGQELYDEWYMIAYNLVLTSLPVVALGVLDQDAPANLCLMFPGLYRQGQRSLSFRWRTIMGWLVNAVVSSVTVYWLSIRLISLVAFKKDGHTADGIQAGTFTFTNLTWAVNCQLALMTTNLSWISHVVTWGSIGAWCVFLKIYGLFINSGSVFHIWEAISSAPVFWYSTVLVVVATLLPSFFFLAIQSNLYPTDDQILQAIEDPPSSS